MVLKKLTYSNKVSDSNFLVQVHNSHIIKSIARFRVPQLVRMIAHDVDDLLVGDAITTCYDAQIFAQDFVHTVCCSQRLQESVEDSCSQNLEIFFSPPSKT